MLTQGRLKELFKYDPDTGNFTRVKFISPNAKIGTVVNAISKTGYVRFAVDGKRYMAHRLAFLYMEGRLPDDDVEVDHIDLNKANNAWANLRKVNHAENSQNQPRIRANNTSGLSGVSWNGVANKWQSNICIRGKTRHLGLYKDKNDAHAAYLTAKTQHHPFAQI